MVNPQCKVVGGTGSPWRECMAVGRISGPLLKANLERNGIDLAVETDLLYIDVTNNRIGVKQSSPAYTLDVNGTIHSSRVETDFLTVADNYNIGNVNITSTVANLELQPATASDRTVVIGDLEVTGDIIGYNDGFTISDDTSSTIDVRLNSTLRLTDGDDMSVVTSSDSVHNIVTFSSTSTLDSVTSRGNATGNDIYAGAFYGDGSNLTGISTTTSFVDLDDTDVAGQTTNTLIFFNGSKYKEATTGAGVSIDGNGIITVDEDTVAIDTSSFINSTSSTLADVLADLDRLGVTLNDYNIEYPTVTGGSADVTISAALADNEILYVYLNGALMRINSDYTLSGTTITFGETLDAADLVTVVDTKSGLAKAYAIEYPIVTNASTNVQMSAAYRLDEISVYLNGIRLKEVEDFSVNGTTLAFDSPLVTNDLVEIHVYKNIAVNNSYINEFPSVTAGSDTVTMSKAYRYDEIEVWLNGAKQKAVDDYTVSGTSLVLGAALTADDFVHIRNSVVLDLRLGDLNDVSIPSINSNSILKYNGTNFVVASQLEENGDAVILKYSDATKVVTEATGITVTGDIQVSGTVDGRDVAADGTKLDGIEANATADQTAAEILTAIKTVDGASSGLDADLLDGQEGSYYLDFSNFSNLPDPTITLGGDLSGSVTLTDLASGTLTATIEANSVALGTDTTGNYVATVSGTANEVIVSGSGSETAAVTVGLPTSVTIQDALTVSNVLYTPIIDTTDSSAITITPPATFSTDVTIENDLAVTSDINVTQNLTVSGHVDVNNADSVITHGDTDYRKKEYILYGTTTNNTETEIFVGGTADSRIPVPSNTTISYSVDIVARRTDAADESGGWHLKAVVDNHSGVINDVGDIYEIIVATDDADWQVDARAFANGVGIFCTGENGKTIRWTAVVNTIEVSQ